MVWNHHASYSFPSELLIILDVLLVLAGAGLLLFAPRLFASLSEWLRAKLAGRLRPSGVVLGLGAFGLIGLAASLFILGLPEAQVPDEASYLLAADTFALGRLSNPLHPMRAHFEMRHVLTEPTYQSKYPPAQGLILAAGQRLTGHPAAGLVLASGLLCLAVGWAFAGALPAEWIAVGGLLVAVRLAIGSYWNQGYWGGSLAAVGGALVLGGLLRLTRRPSWPPGAAIGLGLGALALARPYEGLCLAVGAGTVLIVLSRAWSWSGRLHVAAPIVFIALACVGFLFFYNASVTGSPLLFPHSLYTHQRPDTEAHPELMHFAWEAGSGWLLSAVGPWLTKASFGLYFLLGLSLLLPLILNGRRVLRQTPARIALVLWIPVALAHYVVRPWNPHYVAPAAAAALLVATLGLRAMAEWRVRGVRIGPAAALLPVAIQCVLTAIQLPAHRADPEDWSLQRAAIQRRLESSAGDDLLLVRYPFGRPHQWAWNDADIDSSPVVWANALSNEEDADLQRYFSDRRAWLLEVDFGPEVPKLIPLDPPSDMP